MTPNRVRSLSETVDAKVIIKLQLLTTLGLTKRGDFKRKWALKANLWQGRDQTSLLEKLTGILTLKTVMVTGTFTPTTLKEASIKSQKNRQCFCLKWKIQNPRIPRRVRLMVQWARLLRISWFTIRSTDLSNMTENTSAAQNTIKTSLPKLRSHTIQTMSRTNHPQRPHF